MDEFANHYFNRFATIESVFALYGSQVIFSKDSMKEQCQANGSVHDVKENDSWYIKLEETEKPFCTGK